MFPTEADAKACKSDLQFATPVRSQLIGEDQEDKESGGTRAGAKGVEIEHGQEEIGDINTPPTRELPSRKISVNIDGLTKPPAAITEDGLASAMANVPPGNYARRIDHIMRSSQAQCDETIAGGGSASERDKKRMAKLSCAPGDLARYTG